MNREIYPDLRQILPLVSKVSDATQLGQREWLEAGRAGSLQLAQRRRTFPGTLQKHLPSAN